MLSCGGHNPPTGGQGSACVSSTWAARLRGCGTPLLGVRLPLALAGREDLWLRCRRVRTDAPRGMGGPPGEEVTAATGQFSSFWPRRVITAWSFAERAPRPWFPGGARPPGPAPPLPHIPHRCARSAPLPTCPGLRSSLGTGPQRASRALGPSGPAAPGACTSGRTSPPLGSPRVWRPPLPLPHPLPVGGAVAAPEATCFRLQ